jgi:hypothetical protein
MGQLNEAVLPPRLLTMIEFTPQDREMGIIIQKALRKVIKEAKLTTIGPISSSNTDNDSEMRKSSRRLSNLLENLTQQIISDLDFPVYKKETFAKQQWRLFQLESSEESFDAIYGPKFIIQVLYINLQKNFQIFNKFLELYTILKTDNEPSDISFQSLSEKIKSLILEKKVPWSSIVEVEKARLPMDSSVTNKIPLLESIGTSDVPEISPEEFILQILPATIYSECQACDEDKLIVHGQAADEAVVTLISVLLLSQYVKRPNNPPDERVECDP